MNLLLEQFRDSEILQGLLAAALKQLDLLEAEILLARKSLCLEKAPRFVLERIAKIVGQDCVGLDTESLRLWIRARIAVNRGHGTMEDLYQLVRILVVDEVPFEIREHPEISFTILIHKAVSQDPHKILEIVKEAKPLGVKAHLQVALKNPVFRFDTPQHTKSYFSEWIA